MRGRRNRLEIIGEILELACLGEMTKTGIAYRTNLGFGLAQKYIDELVGRGLLEMKPNGVDGESPRRVYHTTEEGMKVLRKLRELRKMFC
ncbi:MAG: winged helix-turn-helix domain-containing protein [Candidatus Hadarchaeales archaeon]